MPFETTYTWTLENFTALPKEVGYHVVSPEFHQTVANGVHVVWRLVLYPYGMYVNYEGCVSVSLEMVRCSHSAVTTNYMINVHSAGRNYESTNFDDIKFDIRAKRRCTVKQLLSDSDPRSTRAVVKCQLYDTAASGEKLELKCDPDIQIVTQCWSMFEDQKFTDVSLVVGTKEFKLHKFMLAARSPVFAAMLQHDVEETIQNQIVIEDFGPEAIEEAIRFIYSGKFNPKYCSDLLPFSEKYDLQDLKYECELSISRGLNVENAVQMLVLSYTYRAPNLKLEAMTFIGNSTQEVMGTSPWKSLPHQILSDLIKHVCEENKNLLANKPFI